MHIIKGSLNKGLSDGNSITVRIDLSNRHPPLHYADEVANVYMVSVPTSRVYNVNYYPRHVTSKLNAIGYILSRYTNLNCNDDVHV